MSKYADYDYLEIYNELVLGARTIEEKIEEIRSCGLKYRYMVKTIISGPMVESNIYPIYERKKDIPRKDKENPSEEAQINLNDRNAKLRFVRLVNTNFTKNDLVITLTYKDGYLPTEREAKRDITNYIRRLKAYRKKHGDPELKYIYVIGCDDSEIQHRNKKIRIHHHIIINAMDRDVAEDLWKKGRVEAKRLQPDDFNLEGIARYLANQRGKRWYASRNLKKPKEYQSITKLTNRRAEKLAANENDLEVLFEKMYSNKYRYLDCTKYISGITGGIYLYCRMRRD